MTAGESRPPAHYHPASAVPIENWTITATEEHPMPLLTDARATVETAGHAIEALAAHVAELAANPLVDAIAEAGLGMVLTPGQVSAVVSFVSALEAERKAAVSVTPTTAAAASASVAATITSDPRTRG